MKSIKRGCMCIGLIVLSIAVLLPWISVPKAFGSSSTIGDHVWNDLNGNGIQEPSEPGVDSIQVSLTYESDPGTWMTMYTDSNGDYLFADVSFNANVHYFLEFTLPDSTWYFTTGKIGGDPSIDSDVTSVAGLIGKTDYIFVAGGETNLTFDAGILQDISVPLPAPIFLLGTGLLGLAGLRRKKVLKN